MSDDKLIKDLTVAEFRQLMGSILEAHGMKKLGPPNTARGMQRWQLESLGIRGDGGGVQTARPMPHIPTLNNGRGQR